MLGYLRELQRALDVAVVVVHHARKNGSAGAPGQSLRGSGDFFAWSDSLLYLRRHRGQLVLTVEHRGAPAPDPITLVLAVGDDVHLEIATADGEEAAAADTLGSVDLDQAILQTLAQAPEPVTRAELRARLRVRNERLGEALSRLAEAGSLRRVGDRFGIPDSHHP